MVLAMLRVYTLWEPLSRTAKTVKNVSWYSFHLIFVHSIVSTLTTQCCSSNSRILLNPHWSPQVLIAPSKGCFFQHSNTDKSHFQHSWAQSQKQHSTLLLTWASWKRCLFSRPKVCLSNSSMAELKAPCLHSPSPTPKGNASTIPILPSSSHRQLVPATCHIHFLGYWFTLRVVYSRFV